MSSSEQEGAAVPAAAKSSWSSFLRSIASFNGDLSSMTAPAFIVSPTSLTEFSAYWSEMPRLLVAPAKEKDPQKRAMLVLRWFLSTLKQQYASRSEKLGSEKKPLNPFLGELFLGKWEDDEGVTELISEQVSHHPPVTAYSIINRKHGVHLQGYNAQKASFSRTIHVRQVGHAILHLDAYNEDYLITLPSLHIEGLITGSPFVELDKSTYIVGSNGFTSRIDYSGRGWISGSKNTISAKMYPHGKEKSKSKSDTLYSVENGSWSDKFVIKDAGGHAVETYDAKREPKTDLTVAPIEQQDPLETRRAWQKVAEAIRRGDMNAVSHEKTIIEEQQRALRRTEASEKREWERRFFRRVDKLPILEQLMREVPEGKIEEDQTNGIWVFDEEKAKAAKTPFCEYLTDYHPSFSPWTNLSGTGTSIEPRF